MNTISINGMTIKASGNISISNGKVIVNGVDVTPEQKEINIEVTGNVDKMDVDCCSKITVGGNTGSIKTTSGDIDVSGDVLGSISTMSGDIDCQSVAGNVSTMSGDIKHKK